MIHCERLNKRFGSEQVLEEVSFSLAERETLSVLGRSGSGKTTLLKILAGLESADEGEILLKGQRINEQSPQERGIVYLYQEALLFPHLNVFENLAFGLRLRRTPSPEVKRAVEEMLARLGLSEQASKMPYQLSGGQKQRVSFGRALIINPKVLLLDEPFGALDVETRSSMQAFLKEVSLEYQITAIFVTHDLKEALLMGDRIGYMRAGKLDIYDSKEAFVQDPRTEAQSEIEFWKRYQS
ncbi:MAG: ABC transporter ATP-binding protein [Bacteroidota bacterium]